jgi:hypothetical protein
MISKVCGPTNQNYTVLIIFDQQNEPQAIEIGPEREGEGEGKEKCVALFISW